MTKNENKQNRSRLGLTTLYRSCEFISANLGSGDDEFVMEMNPQQKEFLEMSEEFTEPDECNETDVLQVALNKAALKPWISLVKQ